MADIEGNNSANTLTGTTAADVINAYNGNDTVNGGWGDDMIHGGSGNDSLLGDYGADSIQGSSGADYINGGSNDDVLEGGSGNDTIYGGDDRDTIVGGDGLDVLYGGTSTDDIYASGGDTAYGGDDWDTLFSADGENYLYGEGGVDILIGLQGGNNSVAHMFGGEGSDTVWGASALTTNEGQAIEAYCGDDDDMIIGGTWNLWGYGEAGNDLLSAGTGGAIKFLSGGDGDDQLSTGSTNSRLYGDAGFDTFKTTYVAGSTNLADGGADQDTFITDTQISAGDTIIGGAGYDIFDGTALTQGLSLNIGGARLANSADITGIEYLMTGSGDDWFSLTQNDTTLYANDGNDTLYVNASQTSADLGAGSDTLFVTSIQNSSSNSFRGGAGSDWVYVGGSTAASIDLNGLLVIGTGTANLSEFEHASGSTGNDTITGSSGANWLLGNAGADSISGGGGADTIVGGTGRDTMTGGASSDVFVFAAGDSRTGSNADRITDFNRTFDDIDLRGFASSFIGTAAFSSVAGQVRYVQSGQNTIIQIDSDGNGTADSHIRLDAYSAGLTAADFIF